jgi:hypothetical protein
MVEIRQTREWKRYSKIKCDEWKRSGSDWSLANQIITKGAIQ